MTAIVFYFQVHQPHRLRAYRAADVGRRHEYFDDAENRRILLRVAERCYLPMNAVIRRLIDEHDGAFRCAYSLSGTAIDQLRRWAPDALASFVDLAETGCVELLCETSHHSLASVADLDEFEAQVLAQRATVEELFGQRPTTFRNTELVISEAIAARVEKLGFAALLGEGADRLLGDRSPRAVYRPRGCSTLRLLLRSYMFSDDIAFRFSNRQWAHFPMFADTFSRWVFGVPEGETQIGLFMDYETFGEHQWADTGIFEFMDWLPRHLLEDPRFSFRTPAEVAADHPPVAELPIDGVVSWADQERDLTAWLDNLMQRTAHARLYALLPEARSAAERGRPDLLEAWRKLSTSDHVYYMCSKFCSDGDVHEYFSPCENPHDAFLRFSYVLDDLTAEVRDTIAAPRGRRGAKPSPGRRPRRGARGAAPRKREHESD